MKLTRLIPLVLIPAAAFAQTKVTTAPFGTLPDGGTVQSYTLTSPQLEVKLITLGAHITAIQAPDREGHKTDVVLGYDDLAGYLADKNTYMGSVPGRYANRIGKGQFTLDGKQYQLPLNNNGNTLHGGTTGFDRYNWTAKQIPSGVEFTVVSKDGDQGFPGTLTAHVRYTLAADALKIEYSATTDKDTVLNLTNHTYFNLSGHGEILGEKMMINSDKITPVNSGLIPTGKFMPVAGTPFDFQKPTTIGDRINVTAGPAGQQMVYAGGYDHNFVLKSAAGTHLAARVMDPASGRVLTVTTTEPGVQFYTGNFLDGTYKGREGMVFAKHTGFCLETQHFPDSPNQPNFPTTELKPGQTFSSTTTFRFSTEK
ncbi:aldose epimerase family protein [Granulicella tundricola]|nr:aldose epimerase family protein [Granulicella tundricola]